jgi:hypothetical protein
VYTSCVDKNNLNWSPNSGMVDNGIFTWSVPPIPLSKKRNS